MNLAEGQVLSMLEGLEVPVLMVKGEAWTVCYANAAARSWLGASEGQTLVEAMPTLDQARLLAKIARGREARHEQRTLCEPSFTVQCFFRKMSDGSLLMEGRSGAPLEEAQAMVASYSLMVERQKKEIEYEKARVEKLLLNILPRKTVEELRLFGRTNPERFDDISVLFLDFVGFTALSRELTPDLLFAELNDIFTAFDDIVTFYKCERIKTIGDAYLAVCGMPEADPNHACQIVKAAAAMRAYIDERNARSRRVWSCRVGVHSGAVTAGVIGQLKYIYDIFGDGVNTASRMQAHADPMHINISRATRDRLDASFVIRPRGFIDVKGKGELEMFYVEDVPIDMTHIQQVTAASSTRAGLGELFRKD